MWVRLPPGLPQIFVIGTNMLSQRGFLLKMYSSLSLALQDVRNQISESDIDWKTVADHGLTDIAVHLCKRQHTLSHDEALARVNTYLGI